LTGLSWKDRYYPSASGKRKNNASRNNLMKIAIVVTLVVVIMIALVAVGKLGTGGGGGGVGGNMDPNHAQKWYKYCENLALKGAQSYDVEQQFKVCDQIAGCQSHPPPFLGIGDPCVPSYDPPPI
jgi:hypothetical protein